MNDRGAREIELFAKAEDGEQMAVRCGIDAAGQLRIIQTSRGCVTDACFGTGTHVVDVTVDASGIEALMHCLCVDGPTQLLAVLATMNTGEDCLVRICDLMDAEGIAYSLAEQRVAG